MNCAGKTVIVAGGLGGIGYAACESLLTKGVKNLGVFEFRENSDLLQRLVRGSPRVNVQFWKVDVTQKEQIENGFTAAVAQFGAIDIVINCVGIVDEMHPERCIETNLLATVNFNYAAINCMSTSKGGVGGTVLNIASIAGLQPFPIIPVYCATKHAVVGLTKCFGSDFYLETTGMKFIVICPGLTVTPLIETGFQSPFHDVKRFPDDLPQQSAEICGKLIVEVLEQNKNGSVWTIIEGIVEEVITSI